MHTSYTIHTADSRFRRQAKTDEWVVLTLQYRAEELQKRPTARVERSPDEPKGIMYELSAIHNIFHRLSVKSIEKTWALPSYLKT